jgi:hypothetical protein
MNKGLTFRTGQTHVNRWTDDLLRRIEEGQIDPSFVITHTVGLEDGPEMYKTFRDKQDSCIKVVLKPHWHRWQDAADLWRSGLTAATFDEIVPGRSSVVALTGKSRRCLLPKS